MRILLIEDDEILGGAVRDQVIADGHAVDWARRLGDAGEHVKLIAYHLRQFILQLLRGFLLASIASSRVDTTVIKLRAWYKSSYGAKYFYEYTARVCFCHNDRNRSALLF